MTTPVMRHAGVLAVLGVVAALVAFAPAAGASDVPGGLFKDLDDWSQDQDQPPTVNDPEPEPAPAPDPETRTDNSKGDEMEEPKPEPASEQKPAVEPTGDELGPVGHTGAGVYETVWAPDEIVPSALRVVMASDDASVVLFEDEDRSSLAALVVIDSAQAATTYRFENAVPEGHAAKMLDDGSVRFYDAAGAVAGGVAVPWALDAEGTEIATSYSLEGTTLVQTVGHAGAVYPVVADPFWFAVAVVVVNVALRASVYAPAAYSAYRTCQRAGCGPIISKAVRSIKPGKPNPSTRPADRCRVRSRAGCR
jgi:hypothetical protein